MTEIKSFLFDMDGVVTDTEVQYDEFLKSFLEEYQLPSDFISQVKGIRWPEIMKIYFGNFSDEEKNKVLAKVADFDAHELKYIPIPGVMEFIELLKSNGFKIALVTSSFKTKAEIGLKKMGLENSFDAVVTGDDIKNGKPDPECYLLGAKKLGVKPEECIVLEDSFIGIEAGRRAGMKVIGLSTTNSEEALQGKVDKIIPNFEGITLEDIIK